MPTPSIYLPPNPRELFVDLPPDLKSTSLDVLYVTDRAAGQDPSGRLNYTGARSRSMAVGSAMTIFGRDMSWQELAQGSIERRRAVPINLYLGAITELTRFPPIPYGARRGGSESLRDADAVAAHDTAKAAVRAELERRLKAAPRKEILFFVHGVDNTFEDAVLTAGELCHFLGREFVCVTYSWPAGGGWGPVRSYTYDRESSEYTIPHLKQILRILTTTPGVEKVHVLAHSRGTDVVTRALRELNIEAYAAGALPLARYHIDNLVLAAPDIDLDVASQNAWVFESDPDMLTAGSWPKDYLPLTWDRLTVYTSPGDNALGLASTLFGSVLRVGQLTPQDISSERRTALARFGGIDVVQVLHAGDYFGHSYYRNEPSASGDLMAVIRYDLRPGDPGRNLKALGPAFWRVLPKPNPAP
ncbi:MAG TPA: alpha/beta hydrolase [Burkholderiales bacterium]|nr:alpha/beta hydrolase [Burkholderiales bacterium]